VKRPKGEPQGKKTKKKHKKRWHRRDSEVLLEMEGFDGTEGSAE
jgi:hypothetical protein